MAKVVVTSVFNTYTPNERAYVMANKKSNHNVLFARGECGSESAWYYQNDILVYKITKEDANGKSLWVIPELGGFGSLEIALKNY